MQSKRIAAIDLGTNSFHLVIVELKDIRNLNSIKEIESNNSFEVLYRQKEIVRINVGSNGETKNLKPEGIDRALSALKNSKKKLMSMVQSLTQLQQVQLEKLIIKMSS